MNNFSFIRDPEMRVLVGGAIVLALLVVVSIVISQRVERGDVSVPTETAVKSFPQVSIQAQAAYVYDMRTKTVLYAKNENLRLPLASLTKLMSGLVAYELGYEHGTVTISDKALETIGDSGLLKGERWSLKTLLDFSLVTSSNDGMRALALALGAVSKSEVLPEEAINDFVGKMNRKASELGLKNTYFWNETGLDIEIEPAYGDKEAVIIKGGAYGSAKDINALMEHIAVNNPQIFAATKETATTLYSLDRYAHLATNTNAIASEIPGLIASKTGFTNTAGGNLSIIFDPELGRPFVITVLGSSERGRFEDMRNLIAAVMGYINANQ